MKKYLKKSVLSIAIFVCIISSLTFVNAYTYSYTIPRTDSTEVEKSGSSWRLLTGYDEGSVLPYDDVGACAEAEYEGKLCFTEIDLTDGSGSLYDTDMQMNASGSIGTMSSHDTAIGHVYARVYNGTSSTSGVYKDLNLEVIP